MRLPTGLAHHLSKGLLELCLDFYFFDKKFECRDEQNISKDLRTYPSHGGMLLLS